MKNLFLTLLIFHFSLFILNSQTTKPILRLNTTMHTSTINRIDTDAEGKYLLTASADKTAKLWNAQTGSLLKTYRPPIGKGKEGTIYAGAISPNGRIVAIAGWTGYEWDRQISIYVYNSFTGELLKKLTRLNNVVLDLEFAPSGNYLAAALGSGKVIIYETNQPVISDFKDLIISELKPLTGYNKPINNIAFDKTGRLAIVCNDGKICLYDNYFNFIKMTNGAGKRPFSVDFSPSGNKIAVAYVDVPDIEVFSGDSLELLYKPNLGRMNINGGLDVVSFSEDGKYLYGGGGFSKNIDGNWWRVIRKWENAGKGNYIDYSACNNTIMDIKTLSNGDIIYGGGHPDFGRINENGVKIFHNEGEINAYNVKDRSHFKINKNADEIVFSPLGKKAILFSIAERNLCDSENINDLTSYSDNKLGIKVNNWEDTYSPQINDTKLNFLQKYDICRSVDISPNGDKIILGTAWNIYCSDTNGNKLWKVPVQGTSWAVNISDDAKVVASAQNGGLINWYGMENGELLLTLFVHPDNENWLLYNPDGYFDCSPGAEKFAGWHVNQGSEKSSKFYPLSQFYDIFFTPDLGKRVLEGEDIISRVKMDEFKLPPLVKITSPIRNEELRGLKTTTTNLKSNKKEMQIVVKVTDQGGGIDEIRLYNNGKLVNTTQRGYKVVEAKDSVKIKIFNIILSNGDNNFKATAFNNQRTESIGDEINVNYLGIENKINLHLLAIGLDNYKNPKYKLNYALSDATAFKQEIEKGSKSIFGNVKITFLKDADATRAKILQEFNMLKLNVKQNDVFIFYYAGHGVMSQDENSQFYIIPYDVTQLYGNQEILKTKAVSAEELKTFSTELKAQKQLFILDACQSGGITKTLASRGATEEKAIAQLARSTGTYWLTASGSEQFATEFAELGHGVFTYAILKGLQGEADGGNKDKKITVKEISSFLNDKVPELSEKHKGSAQYPTSYGYGQDFPILVVE